MTTTETVTSHTAINIADRINAGFAVGAVTTVNGRELVSRFGGAVATTWNNGSVSVTVKGRTAGKVADLFVKVGQTVQVA